MRRASSAADCTAARISSGLRSPSSARSSSARRVVSGVRNSWLASPTSRRSRATAASIRSSIALRVRLSAPISSAVSEPGSRSASCRSVIRSACARIWSTGRSAARDSSCPAMLARSSASGPAISSSVRRRETSWSRRVNLSATATARSPSGASAGTARMATVPNGRVRRSTSSSPCVARTASAGVSNRTPLTLSELPTTRPAESYTWASPSPLLVTAPTRPNSTSVETSPAWLRSALSTWSSRSLRNCA